VLLSAVDIVQGARNPIAAAADLAFAMEELGETLEKQSGHRKCDSGSAGTCSTCRMGSFDLFFSANMDSEKAGRRGSHQREHYANTLWGRIVIGGLRMRKGR